MNKNILVFGDSIVYGHSDLEGGWVAKLRLFLEQKNPDVKRAASNVYNLGIPGNTTIDLLARFQAETKARVREDYETVFIFAIGLNDSQFLHSKNGLKVELEQFLNNLLQLIEQAKVFSLKITFIGLTPVDETKTAPAFWNEEKSYLNENVMVFDRTVESVCREKEVAFVDVFKKFKSVNYLELLDDGLHPNTKGHNLIFEIIKEAVSL